MAGQASSCCASGCSAPRDHTKCGRATKAGSLHYLLREPESGTWTVRHLADIGDVSVIAPIASSVNLAAAFDTSYAAVDEEIGVRAEADGVAGCTSYSVEADAYRILEGGTVSSAEPVPLDEVETGVFTGTFTPSELGEYTVRAALACDLAGEGVARESWANSLLVEQAGVGTEDEAPTAIPDQVELPQNYPNPSRSRTTIRFAIPEPGPITLKLYDVLGREVAVLREGATPAGWHEVTFDASRFATGIYFLRLNVDGTIATQRLTLVR